MENIKHKHKEGVQLFVNKELELEVRAVEIDGEGWLVGKDIAEALGYKNSRKAILDHVDEEDKIFRDGVTIRDSIGRSQKAVLINESGFYSLILRSDMPKAKQFKRWVTSEVLPQIRKTGGYIPIEEEMSEAEIMAKALIISQKTIEKKDELLKAKDKEIEVLSEDLNQKNRFINQLAASENTLLVREVAKVASKADVVIGEKRLWSKLREWGLIFKNSTEPKQSGIDKGYFEVNEGTKETKGKVFTYRTTRVTGKGQAYIIERLLKEI
ncbi:phage antirepressor [uncultured Clostridium sp.]|uniref:phage antirepressor n=1 Tax=uncultured Clostridium sp. TaxID=59620 RepID=UPI0025F065D4|nr:phage antirepressor [uncultured Clostridium sp.]MDU4882965.1 phage antirepressor [Clostridium celatum]MDU7076134.1 phage antirepressor [Clostridium celatum]